MIVGQFGGPRKPFIKAIEATALTSLVYFVYFKADTTVQLSYPKPSVQMTLIGSPTGDGGDQYVGLDRFGRLVDQRWTNAGATSDLERVQYGYDRASNRVWRANPVAKALSAKQDEFYVNDGLYQLSMRQQGVLNAGKTGISGTPTAEEDFSYDPTGNWNNYQVKAGGSSTLNQARTHNADNEIITLAGAATLVGYDQAGNMTKAPQPLNAAAAYTLTWDAWNRLVKVQNGSTLVASYAYDGLTRRTHSAGLTVNSGLDYFYSDQWKVLQVTPAATADGLTQFVWRGCDEDKLILRDTGGSSTTPHLYALDDGKDVTGVCDTVGAVQERYGYSGFGTPAFMNAGFGSRTSSSYGWETLFCGYRLDSTTKLYQVRFRYLHSQLGRWLSRDPFYEHATRGNHIKNPSSWVIKAFARSVFSSSLYTYVENRPPAEFDPDGLNSVKLECGTTHNTIADLFGARHCAVVTNCKCSKKSERLEIGGNPTGGTPPKFDNPNYDPQNGADNESRYSVTCPDDASCKAAKCLKQAYDSTSPPNYNPLGPNSNTFARSLLTKCGCSVDPFPVPVQSNPGSGGTIIWTDVPVGAAGW